ncbi:zinc finger protein 624-like isoform X14 [Schistocerca nitens]|uniref:zinc finger protein 624-like isoform X14 n=1 Tax=Schistocerca nitens TaxID=7011 RepID=UPI002117C1D0|nr:zinc finger protein 624-like isoform X14 [Schistocerca nitens]
MHAGPYRLVKCPGLHTAAMDYRNIICIKTEPTDEIPTVPDSTVQVYPSTVNVKEELQECVNQELYIPDFDPQAIKEEGLEFDDCLHECDPLDIKDEEVQVCPSTVNVKEELQECVNQEFPEHPLVTLESTNCSKEETQKKLGPEETENILYIPDFDPQAIKEEGLEFDDCLHECDPLDITDQEVQVCPSTVNVKEELQECVNQEFPEHPLVTLESTNCSKEETQKKLGPEETENILYIPEFDPQAIKEEGLEFDDCLHECDPLDITDEEVQVYPSTVNVKEELQECVNQEFPEHPLVTLESTNCSKEETQKKLGPEETENILYIPEFDPQAVKEEGLEFDDCLHECDPLDIADEEGIASKRLAPHSPRLTKIANESGNTGCEETHLQGVTCEELDVDAEKSTHVVRSGSLNQVCFSKQDNALCARSNNSFKENEFTCSSCKQTFLSKYSLIMHVFTHIDGVQPPVHICTTCGEVFHTHDGLSRHSKVEKRTSQEESEQHSTVSNIKRNRSDIFGESYSQSSPSVTNNDERPHVCDVCGKSFDALRSLKKHYFIHTDNTSHKCKICGVAFTRYCHLKQHVLSHTGERPHKCNVCEKSFILPSHLKTHSLIHIGGRPYNCEICGKSFTACGNLKKHILIHTGERPHKCHVCGKSYTVADTLKHHLLIHTGEKPYKCEFCGKSFTRLNILKAHLIQHTGEASHKCNVCGESFTNSWNLNVHTLIHNGEERHKCDICGKLFTNRRGLKAHNLRHTGEKPHVCNVCGKSFTESGGLRKHVLIHTGERPHKCVVCGKSFRESRCLKKHNLIHTGERPYKCNNCGKAFTQSGSLNAHRLIHIRQGTKIL